MSDGSEESGLGRFSTLTIALRVVLSRTDHPMLCAPDYHSGGECSMHALVHPLIRVEDIEVSQLYLWIVGITMIHLLIGMKDRSSVPS